MHVIMNAGRLFVSVPSAGNIGHFEFSIFNALVSPFGPLLPRRLSRPSIPVAAPPPPSPTPRVHVERVHERASGALVHYTAGIAILGEGTPSNSGSFKDGADECRGVGKTVVSRGAFFCSVVMRVNRAFALIPDNRPFAHSCKILLLVLLLRGSSDSLRRASPSAYDRTYKNRTNSVPRSISRSVRNGTYELG